MSEEMKLPVHGFVLAGGKSSRMGRDKALLPFRGKPMVEIAVEKLRGFCAEVSIAGNRDDLSGFAHVVHETRVDCGPAAGIEAGLRECSQPWAIFVPVDVPLVPVELLRRWAEELTAGQPPKPHAGDLIFPYHGSTLRSLGRPQPTFVMLRARWTNEFAAEIERKQGRLWDIFDELRRLDREAFVDREAADFSPLVRPTQAEMDFWFSNVNDAHVLEIAELWAKTWEGRPMDPCHFERMRDTQAHG